MFFLVLKVIKVIPEALSSMLPCMLSLMEPIDHLNPYRHCASNLSSRFTQNQENQQKAFFARSAEQVI